MPKKNGKNGHGIDNLTGDASHFDMDPLDPLCVIQRLEVSTPQLEPHRLRVLYRVTRNGQTDSTELAYRFHEDVFTPGESASHNLASMLSAQVALNYGLFCEEIVFHGLFDLHDRLFIQEMARNTAREIFVKKFLEPNPFLRGAATRILPVRQDSYLRAQILFPEEASGTDSPWQVDPAKYAVLSSGGKDSLLSFGLLREIGREVHPIFINESGRHWFTALNAYRHFDAQVPETARVWTNSDRVFSWMLRHLPFVRQDFAHIRSDEYPIRLWTVAVFLFGALPIMRKRGIRRLVIGDEYDTTHRATLHGIAHYDGLYDQSRYFDNAMTRYFHAKGWNISQFSILRPLSELLIQKTLVQRYPELQELQVSCHAAHKDDSRVRPCGRCEKCRRIVGMLSALNADPTRCGYTEAQINHCLDKLAGMEIHQEAEGIQHVAHLLKQRGLLNGSAIGRIRARERPEILMLRFDPEKSPLEGIPADLREPVYRMLMEHAQGAVRKSGRVWIDCNPFGDAALSRPYPFETPAASPISLNLAPGTEKGTYGTGPVLGEMTWPMAQRRFKEIDVALLPVGSTEQHGPHLPLDTDAFDAQYLARRVAEACEHPKPIVLPTLPYGVSYHHGDFKGTISISPDTLSQLVYEIGMSAARNGITKLVIINGHGGNGPALHFAAQMINRDAHIFTCVDTGESSDPDIHAMTETPNDVHAGEIETSTALAVRPDLVRLKELRKFVPRFSSHYLDFTSKRSVGWYASVSKISPSGVLGDPTKASREKGERIWEVMIMHLVRLVADLKAMSLDEIYQKRY